MQLDKALNRILQLQSFWQGKDSLEMHERGILVRDTIPHFLLSELKLINPSKQFGFSVEGSDGIGRKTRIPWIRIFSQNFSPRATEGWYIVYLFASDGSNVYLSLNQGTTTYENGKLKSKPFYEIQQRTEKARILLSKLTELPKGLSMHMELKDSGQLGNWYELGNVFNFEYPIHKIPDSAILIQDINLMLDLLSILYEQNKNDLYTNAIPLENTLKIREPSDSTTDGTEPEDIGISKPFDPTLINISTKQMSLDTLIRRIREQEVDLSPGFQRAEVWKPTSKSRLIESLLIRIPLPAFYMDATNEDKWVVVDGLQRLSTLRDFVINKTMHLENLEFLSQFQSLTFDQLPRNYQRRIEETQVTVYLIDKGTPPDVKFNIFKRINTGGMPLSSQEIRHALNQGPVTLLLKELANSKEFKQATNNSINDNRMAARECVLRFLAFTLTPPVTYDKDDFDQFLSSSMALINKMTDLQRAELANRLLRALRYSYFIFGKSAFRKPGKSRPINKALFEIWTVALDKQTDEQLERLLTKKNEIVDKIVSKLHTDNELENAISQGTGDISKVRLRFSRFQKIIEGALDD